MTNARLALLVSTLMRRSFRMWRVSLELASDTITTSLSLPALELLALVCAANGEFWKSRKVMRRRSKECLDIRPL
jgi:hypothetical protein